MKESVEPSCRSWWLRSTISLSRTGKRQTVVAGSSLGHVKVVFSPKLWHLHEEVIVE